MPQWKLKQQKYREKRMFELQIKAFLSVRNQEQNKQHTNHAFAYESRMLIKASTLLKGLAYIFQTPPALWLSSFYRVISHPSFFDKLCSLVL